jgi:hypothetical protein
MIGGERWLSSQVVRDGICSGNTVFRARSSYEDGYAAGIYVDGGENIIIERNRVFECDLGIEAGAENSGVTVRDIIIRNNLIYYNDKAGIAVGAFSRDGGEVTRCKIINNTFYKNNRVKANGEIWLQYTGNIEVYNNIVYSAADVSGQVMLFSSINYLESFFISMDYNIFYVENPHLHDDIFLTGGDTFTDFSAYKQETGQDSHSLFSNPEFLTLPGSSLDGFTPSTTSPARNAGIIHDAQGEDDYYGNKRLQGPSVDIGAVEQK